MERVTLEPCSELPDRHDAAAKIAAASIVAFVEMNEDIQRLRDLKIYSCAAIPALNQSVEKNERRVVPPKSISLIRPILARTTHK